MPHPVAFYDWKARVDTLFEALKPHHRGARAEYRFGMILARCCGLTSAVAYLAAFLAVRTHARRQRLRERYQPASAQIGTARSEFDFAVCFAPLVRWAAAGQSDTRSVLALDPTNRTDRFRVPRCSTAVAACPSRGPFKRHTSKGSWNATWFDLLGRLKAAPGDGWTVLVLTDRGLESPDLFREIVRLGWHPLMRVEGCATFRPADGRRGHRMPFFDPVAGRRWFGAGVAYPTGARRAWTRLASWDEGHEEPWLIRTDRPAPGANPAWYAWRMWIEPGFRVLERGGWQWRRTQMTDPLRVARLWAVIAVATVYAVERGGEAEPADVPPVRGPRSRLRRGLLRIWAARMNHESLPKGRLERHDWPERTEVADPLVEPYVHKG